ncbi:hypothetical protein [Parvibaculum sp.]|uniref:hypothetical protein n=1 Tax=Parvibaculum sp. TaxID=2024848 RepID=UPI002BB7C853|nr:hypothetical protein [Parvibaculum sp.]HUD51178.1 hypothetical protein [Parvibaculum sp.]
MADFLAITGFFTAAFSGVVFLDAAFGFAPATAFFAFAAGFAFLADLAFLTDLALTRGFAGVLAVLLPDFFLAAGFFTAFAIS